MDFENCKNAAQFPFMQPKNTSLVSNTAPFIDFGLILLAIGCVEPTIRISVVMRPLNFSFFNRVQGLGRKSVERGVFNNCMRFSQVRQFNKVPSFTLNFEGFVRLF